MEVVVSLSQGRTAAAQCGLFTHKSVPVIFEPPCNKVVRESPSHAHCDEYLCAISYLPPLFVTQTITN